MMERPEEIRASDVSFLPIVAWYVKRLGIVDVVNRLCPTKRGIPAGDVMLALIMDTITGRSPLYKLEQSFAQQDMELLFGRDIPVDKLNDDLVGRSMDAIYDAGTGLILTAVAVNAVRLYELETRCAHHDTTSLMVYGDYDLYEEAGHGHPFVVARGYSKDHRPDLKQIVLSLLCVDRGIPVAARLVNGNESDKVINRHLLSEVAQKMQELGERDPIYIGDSSLVTADNLELLADEEKGCRFITRLPRTYKECREVVAQAAAQKRWEDLGVMSPQRPTAKRKPARYHGYEAEVTLYGRRYRALVVHSDALDKKSVKKLESEVEQDKKELARHKEEQEKISYACLPDAQRALMRLPRGRFHRMSGEIYEVAHYPKGRPKAGEERMPARIDYRLTLRLEPDEEALARRRYEAGCFVLLTNIAQEGPRGMASYELLATYKAQDMVERNFGFLKDDAIVNSLFLKTPARIEVLGLVLVLSLMVWRLMERTMRRSLQEKGGVVEGWDKKPTSRPTSLMIVMIFLSMVVIRMPEKRFLANGISQRQRAYLDILGVPPGVFTEPQSQPGGAPCQDAKSWEIAG